MMARAWWLAAGPSLWAAASTVACSTTAPPSDAGLMVIVSGDLMPSEYDEVRVEVRQQEASGQWQSWLDLSKVVPSEVTLPTTVFIEAGRSPDQEVDVRVTAYSAGMPIVLREAQLQAPTNRIATLYFVLAEVCKGQVRVTGAEGEPESTCPTGESCQPGTGTCGSDMIATSTLPTFVPGQSLDAGGDAGLFAGGPLSASDADAGDASCTNQCAEGALQCASGGGAVQTCTVQSSGCTQWTTSASCGTHQTCTGTGSASACTCLSSICSEAGTTCQDGQTLATCMVDGDSCPYVQSRTTCPGSESCAGMAPSAACSSTCASSCSHGQTMCVSGGLATCTQGANGCWAYGTPVACPSTNQSCSGSPGSATCTCNPSAVCTAAANVCTNGATVANCAEDQHGCFYEASSSGCPGSAPFCNDAGVCGVCQNGTSQCSGNTPQTCTNGQWVSAAACVSTTCVGGTCGGVCGAGQTQCVSGTTVRTCGSDGQWGAATTCPDACVSTGGGGSAGNCGGVCVPGTSACNGTNQVETCNASGAWGTPSACPVGPCSAGQCLRPTAISAGNYFTCALLSDGSVSCWGGTYDGALGSNSTGVTPAPVVGLSGGVLSLATASWSTCALLQGGSVECWGRNDSGELGNGTTTSSSTPTPVSNLTNATAVSAGDLCSCAIVADKTVRCWGYNADGELGNGTTSNSSVPVTVSNLTGATAIASGNSDQTGAFTCAVLSTGGVKCWGYNAEGQLGNGTTTNSSAPVSVTGLASSATAIGAGGYHGCALLSSGALQCWGYSGYGELGNGSTTSSSVPVSVTGGASWSAVAGGGFYTCGLSAASAECWGDNSVSELGNGTSVATSSTPVLVSTTGAAVVSVAAGVYHACALLSDGTVECWGHNNNGQLGNGTTTDSPTPVKVLW